MLVKTFIYITFIIYILVTLWYKAGLLETDLWHFICLKTGNHCKEMKPSGSDEDLGNIYMISPPRKKAIYFLMSPNEFSADTHFNISSLSFSWQQDLLMSFSWQNLIICHICHFSILKCRDSRIVYHKSFQTDSTSANNALDQCGGEPSLFLSICQSWAVLGPVQAFVFKSDAYRGTDSAGIIITGRSEMSRRARTYGRWGILTVLCLLSRHYRADKHSRYSWNIPTQSETWLFGLSTGIWYDLNQKKNRIKQKILE